MILSIVTSLLAVVIHLRVPPETVTLMAILECDNASASSTGPPPPPGAPITFKGRFQGECDAILVAFDQQGKQLKREQRHFFARTPYDEPPSGSDF